MVEQSRSRGRAEAWRPWIAAGRRPALAWPQSLRDFARRAAQRVREWATAEVAPGRLVPWLASAFGGGTIIYFAVEQEPAPWAAALLLAATVAAAILCRHQPFALLRIRMVDGEAVRREYDPHGRGRVGEGLSRVTFAIGEAGIDKPAVR